MLLEHDLLVIDQLTSFARTDFSILDGDGNPADVQPVSLVDPTAPGTYAVPAELDPDTYSVVDISIEPRDGDDAHSGRSILRGQLSA